MYISFSNEHNDDDDCGGGGDYDDEDDNVIAERSYCVEKCNIRRCSDKSYRIGDRRRS